MLRIIQAGLGGWGQDWNRNILRKAHDVEAVAFVDGDASTLEHARRQLKLPADRCFASLETALQAVETDAVLVTASLAGHVPLALTALEAGKHLLLEKPFAPSYDEARRIVDVAAAHNRVLQISQNYRFFPAARAVAQLVRSGELGAVGSVRIDFRRCDNSAPREGHRHYSMRHPLLMDMAIHHFDLLRAVLGKEPQTIFCSAFQPSWGNYNDPPAATAAMTFEDGIHVSYDGSWVSTGPQTAWAGDWHIECERGEIAWTSRADSGTRADKVTVQRFRKRAEKIELPTLAHFDRAGSLATFRHAVATGVEPECSGRDNLGSIALMFAAIASAESGALVRLDGAKGA